MADEAPEQPEKSKSSSAPLSSASAIDQKWFRPASSRPIWYRRISVSFREFLLSQHLVDVTFICRDGQVKAHRLILASCSPFLRAILIRNAGGEDEEGHSHISVPDLSAESLQVFIDSIYLGAVPKQRQLFLQLRSVCAFFKLTVGYSEDSLSEAAPVTEIIVGVLPLEKSKPQSSLSLVKSITFGETAANSGDILQTNGEKLLLVNCYDESLSTNISTNLCAKALPRTERAQATRDSQHRPCVICGKRALDHRVLVEEDERTPLGSLFIYRCCLHSCVDKAMRSAKVFHVHMSRHDGSVLLNSASSRSCPLCSKPRVDHKNRSVVIGRNKKKGSLYKCCQCSAQKLSASKFFNHAENHLAKKFQCVDCGKGYSYQHLLDQHVHKEHGEGRQEVFRCRECSFETRYKQTLLSHRQEKHEGLQRSHRQQGDNSQTVVCPTCKKELKKWYYQQYHKKTCSVGTTIYQCDMCLQEGFVNKTTLQNHIRSKHSQDRPFVCEHCPAKYATAMSLSGHRSRKHSVNKAGEFVPKKLFPCSHCGKLLSTRSKLAQHVRTIHDNEKEFKCTFCDKRFTSKSNRSIHEGTIHTGVLPYKCDLCLQYFARKSGLAQHMEQQHQLRKSSSSGHEATATTLELGEVDFGPAVATVSVPVTTVTTGAATTAASNEADTYMVVEAEEVMEMID